MLQDLNLCGGWGHTFGQDTFAEQCVDESRLSGVELADDHQQKQLVELLDRSFEHRRILRARFHAGQQAAQTHQFAAFGLQDLFFLIGQESVQGHRFSRVMAFRAALLQQRPCCR